MTTFRNYPPIPGFTEDWKRVRDFLIRINEGHMSAPGFLWGRWEWGFSLPYLDKGHLDRIGLWEENGEIVAIATYEQGLGQAWLCIDERYSALKPRLLEHAKERLSKDGCIQVLIPDSDRELQRTAFRMGFRPTQDTEHNAVMDICPETLRYELPEGYTVTSLRDDYDMRKYNSVLWKGFNHGDDPPETDEQLEERRISLSGPDVIPDLNIAVVAPDGEWVSYCGMWYLPDMPYAMVEPVATIPSHRRMGAGRAAVLEAVKRCGESGAKRAFVGSSQQFYYSIGFYPYSTETFWELRSGA